jgi:hypothetical protein
VAQNFEAGIIEQMSDVSTTTGEEVVGANNVRALFYQCLAQMGAEKACPAGDQYAFIEVVFLHHLFILTF